MSANPTSTQFSPAPHLPLPTLSKRPALSLSKGPPSPPRKWDILGQTATFIYSA
jgi:hypothetical protein